MQDCRGVQVSDYVLSSCDSEPTVTIFKSMTYKLQFLCLSALREQLCDRM